MGAPRAGLLTAWRAAACVAALHLLFAAGLEAQSAPPTEAGFVLVQHTELAGANAGTMYRYQRPDGVGVELFVTPLPPSFDPCTELCAERAVELLSSQFTRAFMIDLEHGAADSVRRVGSIAVAPPPGSWLERGQLTALREYHGDRVADSYVWLFLGRETLIQVRGAYPAGELDFNTLERFVQTIVLAVPAPYDCPRGVSTEPALLKLYPLDVPMARLPFLVDSTLAALGYNFDFRSEATGLWRTMPRYAWPAGSTLDATAGTTRPGIVLVVVVASDEGHSVVGISARGVCQVPVSPAHPGATAQLVRMAADSALDAIVGAAGHIR